MHDVVFFNPLKNRDYESSEMSSKKIINELSMKIINESMNLLCI